MNTRKRCKNVVIVVTELLEVETQPRRSWPVG